jgi:hypothetical protein
MTAPALPATPLGPVARRLVRAYVDGRLPSFLARHVWARVVAEPAWARAYHELRIAERALAGDALGGNQLAAVRARVLAAAKAGHTPGAESTRDAGHARSPRMPAWLPASFAAASVAAFFVVARPAEEGAGDELSARSGASVAGLRVACLNAERSAILAEVDVRPDAHLVCAADGALAFLATNTTDQERWVALLVSTNEGATEGGAFAVPFAGEEPIKVPPGTVAAPLARGFPLQGFGGRTVRVAGFLSEHLVAHEDVVTRVTEAHAPAVDVSVGGR